MPDELDPQVKEFAGQLRRLVDRGGLSIAALADRTGYSKTSWERYLNGRLLAPKGAIIALAEVTGTHPVHLTTMWELAERAWSRSEMRHDRTMEAIRISQARAALGEFGAPAAGAAGGGMAARAGGRATVAPGVAGVSPTIPPQPTAPDADAREGTGGGSATGGNSWRLSGYQGPSKTAGRASSGPAAPGSYGQPLSGSRDPHGPQDPQGVRSAQGARQPGGASEGRRRLTMFVAGAAGVLVLVAAVFFLTGNGGDGRNESTAQSTSPSATVHRGLPAGVKCAGADCTGRDAESMGCSGELVTTAKTATVGTTVVEVRYSKTCRAAWGRITGAAQGDAVRVSAGTRKVTGSVTDAGDTIAYTPMVAVKDAAGVRACVTLASGQKGCTN
ncbi:helix-turn-helix domain-containing protein [Streptomyces sp. NPDC051636]|uniref:helix-turn-helix domain-containing protein n=1 Tax=Streptomyces sp. NPDC051636 TaxID=3365663 RepID=UPI0037AF1364